MPFGIFSIHFLWFIALLIFSLKCFQPDINSSTPTVAIHSLIQQVVVRQKVNIPGGQLSVCHKNIINTPGVTCIRYSLCTYVLLLFAFLMSVCVSVFLHSLCLMLQSCLLHIMCHLCYVIFLIMFLCLSLFFMNVTLC